MNVSVMESGCCKAAHIFRTIEAKQNTILVLQGRTIAMLDINHPTEDVLIQFSLIWPAECAHMHAHICVQGIHRVCTVREWTSPFMEVGYRGTLRE